VAKECKAHFPTLAALPYWWWARWSQGGASEAGTAVRSLPAYSRSLARVQLAAAQLLPAVADAQQHWKRGGGHCLGRRSKNASDNSILKFAAIGYCIANTMYNNWRSLLEYNETLWPFLPLLKPVRNLYFSIHRWQKATVGKNRFYTHFMDRIFSNSPTKNTLLHQISYTWFWPTPQKAGKLLVMLTYNPPLALMWWIWKILTVHDALENALSTA